MRIKLDPLFTAISLAHAAPFDINSVAALLVTDDQRYLLQLRDKRNGLPLSHHWVLFGGGIETGETEACSIVRELLEELGFVAPAPRWYCESVYILPRAEARRVRRVYFEVKISEEEIASMILREGAGMRLFRVPEILELEKVSPWDLGAIIMHARGEQIFAL